MRISSKLLLFLTIVLAMSFLPQQTLAEYPDRPISFIVPFGAGGGFDQMVRVLVPLIEREFNVPIAIKNNPGAGGRRGSMLLHRSKPDGYTIGLNYFVPFLVDKNVLGKLVQWVVFVEEAVDSQGQSGGSNDAETVPVALERPGGQQRATDDGEEHDESDEEIGVSGHVSLYLLN